MDLDETRKQYPTHIYKNEAGKDTECLIPFSSDIKFNAFIRDMSGTTAGGTESQLTVFLKGAPERILTRCSKILINGEEQDFTDELRDEVNKANSTFGGLGERVLAFAKYTLPADKYTKDYQFDVKTWKDWGLDAKRSNEDYADQAGTFPMHGLTLVGVVSLNDPPRTNVDLSVSKCRSAGIKVIMVTGDQPPTAAAIAAKVNIIKHPKMEFNNMVAQAKENGTYKEGVTEEQMMAKSTGIVIHGDELARRHLAEEKENQDRVAKGQPEFTEEESGAFI
jgi:sodium/potassium-transporting ATPase subunit alpha